MICYTHERWVQVTLGAVHLKGFFKKYFVYGTCSASSYHFDYKNSRFGFQSGRNPLRSVMGGGIRSLPGQFLATPLLPLSHMIFLRKNPDFSLQISSKILSLEILYEQWVPTRLKSSHYIFQIKFYILKNEGFPMIIKYQGLSAWFFPKGGGRM